ncbi:DNA polymerase III subunit delta [Allopontixanthobacter sp.]|uniref:DNA polymerase III subunit delta n=1 Tax=Allopontixanthobacter sp. TaxID=2906452 RepID=UPI002ABB9605|nr:DNA polymerase III subunit delta [Allopontixanthobacter sp.]MDZ4307499.1 DNA polymerase III subunit delta [Allopontixanthobacter sp.]
MKATQRDFGGAAARAARECSVFFFCGPDEGGASAAAHRIIALLDDPGERIELSGSDLRKDPVRLGDEARSTSLFGDARHLFVRASGDEAHDAVKILLDGMDQDQGAVCPVLIVATSATDKARTAKLLEKRGDALVAMFWPPDLGSVSASVRTMADAAGLRLNGDIAERIARGAGLDVRLAQSEVTKLALYLDASPEAPRSADAEALAAIGAPTEEDGFMPLVNAVLSGELGKLPGELQRMHELSLNPVGVLLAFERRTVQLAQLSARIGPRGDISSAMKGEIQARRVFFKDQRDISQQLQRWRGRKLDRLVAKLVLLHQSLLSNSQHAELLLGQGLTEIARFAGSRR